MVLVPEDMYRGMIAASESLSDTARVVAAKKEADRVLVRSRKNKGTRRTLYDKKLRDFLKLRKEVADKPVKVEISGSVPVGRPAQATQPRMLSESTQTDAIPTSTAEIQVDTTKKKKKKTPKKKDLSHSQHEDEALTEGEQWQPPPRSPPAQTSSTFDTPRTSRIDAKKDAQQERQEVLQKHINELVNYVSENRNKFGVTEDGGVIGAKNNVINRSNYQEVISNLLNPVLRTQGSPPGTFALRGKLTRDSKAASLINKALFVSNQSGFGIASSKVPFKPVLWTRS